MSAPPGSNNVIFNNNITVNIHPGESTTITINNGANSVLTINIKSDVTAPTAENGSTIENTPPIPGASTTATLSEQLSDVAYNQTLPTSIDNSYVENDEAAIATDEDEEEF